MSVKVMSWVWDHSRSRGSNRLVLLAIADCASEDGSNAYPSMAELVRKTGLSERTVQYCIKSLMADGELFVSANGGPRGCNRYRVITTGQPPQDLHPADFAPPPQILRDTLPDNSQVWVVTPAGSAPRNDCTPQDLHSTPAESAPGTVLNRQRPKTKNSSSEKTTPPLRPDVERVCAHLADRIEANGSLRPNITKRWRDAARLLIDKDGRTVEQVIKAIDWCQDDDFWRSNVLSMPKLRDKYDQLRLAAMRPAGQSRPAGRYQAYRDPIDPASAYSAEGL